MKTRLARSCPSPSTSPRLVGEVALIRHTISHYSPVRFRLADDPPLLHGENRTIAERSAAPPWSIATAAALSLSRSWSPRRNDFDHLNRFASRAGRHIVGMNSLFLSIAPTGHEPGLIGYECPRCGYVTSVVQPPKRRTRARTPTREGEKSRLPLRTIPENRNRKLTGTPAERSARLTVYQRITTAGGLVGSVVHASSSQPLARLRCGSPRGIGVRDQCRHVPRAESLKFPNSGTRIAYDLHRIADFARTNGSLAGD
jgi:hypothetical protein